VPTRSIDVMLSKPGIYVVFTAVGCSFVEVLPGGRCFQLSLTDYSHDGELSPEGWNARAISVIHGPFARVS
jgi:hypothetical protein